MCSPWLFNCTAIHYPLLVSSALDRFDKEVHLSKGARHVLFAHGNAHKAEFEAVLKEEDQKAFDDLSEALFNRLKIALEKSKSKDPRGRSYNPPRIDEEALQEALRGPAWVPNLSPFRR